MSGDNYEPTKLEILAALVTGSASLESRSASVQRSHRFPLHIFTQIENLARIGEVPVSLIINELLECGLEALLKELPTEVAEQVRLIHKDQLNRALVTDSVEVNRKKKPKIQPVK